MILRLLLLLTNYLNITTNNIEKDISISALFNPEREREREREKEGVNRRLTTWIGWNNKERKKLRIKAAIYMPSLLLSHAVHKSQNSDAQRQRWNDSS